MYKQSLVYGSCITSTSLNSLWSLLCRQLMPDLGVLWVVPFSSRRYNPRRPSARYRSSVESPKVHLRKSLRLPLAVINLHLRPLRPPLPLQLGLTNQPFSSIRSAAGSSLNRARSDGFPSVCEGRHANLLRDKISKLGCEHCQIRYTGTSSAIDSCS